MAEEGLEIIMIILGEEEDKENLMILMKRTDLRTTNLLKVEVEEEVVINVED